MDFIKTSSLRALIELTFQRNWNGLIWMSRKGVTTKRVKTAPDALSRISAQPRSPAGRGTNVPRSARISSVRLKSRPKSKTVRPIAQVTTRETIARGRPRHATTAHDQTARAGSNASRPRNSSRAPRTNAPSDPGNYVPRPTEISSAKFSPVRPQRPTTHPSDPDRSDSATIPIVRPIVPHDRPNAAVDPKPFLKPKLMFSSPA
ncbi:unnamed protein product [Microthlaspi erraticum]|uniref:Uncharacterized protein n=1 Tax=Microthlaspi erraticum TaxID=1685480 RepID=A0A6D2KXK5_9BRAS|nr:unnamed protein product [Microthlaspi erraticum]